MKELRRSRKMSNTRKFEELGWKELRELRDMIISMIDSGVLDDFCEDGVVWEFNPNSDKMFFVNDDYQVCMLNDGKLESWYNTPYEGHEGFKEDLIKQYEEGYITDEEDIQYLIDMKFIKEAKESEE